MPPPATFEGHAAAPRVRVRQPAGAQRAGHGQAQGHRVRAGPLPPAPGQLAAADHLRAGELRDRQRRLGLGRLGQHAADLARIDGLHREPQAGHDAELRAGRERARQERVELRRAHDRPGDARALDQLLLRELGLVVADADAVDADDRDADVVTHLGLLGGAQQPRRAVHEHVALAVGGIDDHVDAVERGGQAAAVAQVDGVLRRVSRQDAHRVPAALELARRLGADGSGSTHDCDSHTERTGQGRAM